MALNKPTGRPTFISGTSTEFLGNKPMPHALRLQLVVFVLGPPGSGKTSVARRLSGPAATELDDQALARAVTHRTRYRKWPNLPVAANDLILEGPCFLARRPGFAQAVAELLGLRLKAGIRTVVTEPSDGSTMRALLDAVPVGDRATVLLRFPVGRGRRRFALKLCEELDLDRSMARATSELDPWTYDTVRNCLMAQASGSS
jgi:hypothetical protein